LILKSVYILNFSETEKPVIPAARAAGIFDPILQCKLYCSAVEISL